MKLTLPYGRGHIDVEVPSRQTLGVLEAPVKATRPEEDVIRDALHSPIGSPSLKKILRKGERTTIVIPDATRRCAARMFLSVLIDLLNGVGIKDDDVFIVFANGSHGAQTEGERREVLGEELLSRVTSVDHDCDLQDEMVYLGDTVAGTPVYLNKYVVKAERLIMGGGVSHHHLTGYSGGPKLLNPGCAARQTILKCHSLGVTKSGLHGGCDAAIARNNPIYQDILDSTKFVHIDFSLHLIIDKYMKIAGACAGAPLQSFNKARELVDAAYKVPVPQKVDLVVASCGGAPFDDDVIKAFRSINNAARILNDGGHLILFAECRQGIGSRRFFNYFEPPTLQDLAAALLEQYDSYGNTALGLRELTRRIRITIVGKLKNEDATRVGLESVEGGEDLIASAIAALPISGKFAVIPNAHFAMTHVQEG